MSPRTLCALGLAIFVAVTPATAQEGRTSTPPGDFAGKRVTVTLEGPKQSLRGRLVSFDSVTLIVEFPNDSPGGSGVTRETLPTGRVRQIDVDKRDPIWNGAVLGAVVMVVCAVTWCQQGLDGPSDAGDAFMAAAMGALLGGGIDALSHQRQTIYEARPAQLTPGSSSAQLAFRIKF